MFAAETLASILLSGENETRVTAKLWTCLNNLATLKFFNLTIAIELSLLANAANCPFMSTSIEVTPLNLLVTNLVFNTEEVPLFKLILVSTTPLPFFKAAAINMVSSPMNLILDKVQFLSKFVFLIMNLPVTMEITSNVDAVM